MGTNSEKPPSARGVVTPRCGQVRELQSGLLSADNPGATRSSFVPYRQHGPGPMVPASEDLVDDQVNALRTASAPLQPGALFAGRNPSKGFHFDPIATIVQVDFPSRMTGGPGPPQSAAALGRSPSAPARNGQSADGLDLCGTAARACLKATGLKTLDLDKDCASPEKAQDGRPAPPRPGAPPGRQRSVASSMFFCCPEDQMVLRGAQGNRSSISTRG